MDRWLDVQLNMRCLWVHNNNNDNNAYARLYKTPLISGRLPDRRPSKSPASQPPGLRIVSICPSPRERQKEGAF